MRFATHSEGHHPVAPVVVTQAFAERVVESTTAIREEHWEFQCLTKPKQQCTVLSKTSCRPFIHESPTKQSFMFTSF
jgi:hypothetical protein